MSRQSGELLTTKELQEPPLQCACALCEKCQFCSSACCTSCRLSCVHIPHACTSSHVCWDSEHHVNFLCDLRHYGRSQKTMPSPLLCSFLPMGIADFLLPRYTFWKPLIFFSGSRIFSVLEWSLLLLYIPAACPSVQFGSILFPWNTQKNTHGHHPCFHL